MKKNKNKKKKNVKKKIWKEKKYLVLLRIHK